MEVGTLEMQRGQLGVGHADTCGILASVEFGENPQSGLGGRVGDQLHDHVVADQRPAAPIAADVGELAMLDLVPLTRSERHVTYVDGHPQFDRQLLQSHLPQARAAAVTAPAVVADQQLARGQEKWSG